MTHRFLISEPETNYASYSEFGTIESSFPLKRKNEKDCWEKNYLENYYDEVLNVTGCQRVNQRITQCLDPTVQRVHIPGCGSKPHLQRYLIENFPNLDKVICTDWSETALTLARRSFDHPKLVYQQADTSQLNPDDGPCDCVIVVNSILSASDILNRQMIRACHRVLKQGGLFIGLFPDVLCSVELSSISSELSELLDGTIDVGKNMVYERRQGMNQIFYTPLRLKQIFIEAGFEIKFDHIQRIAFDSPFFQGEYLRLYGLQDPDLCIWENIVEVKKS
ncbi:class I SAM-dependent methyltransferase [bacterium]|nr:class I SAM-dependent methyltransferase [bacterium]